MPDPTATSNYPKEIEVPLTLTIFVNNADEESAYLEVVTKLTGTDKTVVQMSTPAKSLLIDTFDSFMPYEAEQLVAINGLTEAQVNQS